MNSWAKLQLEEVNPKMGYFGGPNMPLSQKSGFKANLVSFWRPNREEKKRKRKRKKMEEIKQAKVWNFGFLVWKLL